MFYGSGQALAAGPLPCDVTTGVAGNGECQITTLHNLGAGGVWTVDRTLHIIGPSGELRTNAASTLTLSIAGGATNGLIIETGGIITGNATGTAGVGATININVDNGNILLAASGATISAANTAGGGCGSGRGGVINMTASGISAKIITEDGTTISASGSTCSGGGVSRGTAEAPPLAGTLIGLDFGEKRLGVAVGETATGLAHPVAAIAEEATEARFAAIARLVAEWHPAGFVVGLPRHRDGGEHEVARLAGKFARRLGARFGLPVAFVDETLTSAEAASRPREAGARAAGKGDLDAHAAALILQSYLDDFHPSNLPHDRTSS